MLLLFSVDCYLVKSPNDNEGWFSHRPGRITWVRVDTDPSEFAVVLTRQQPPYNSLIYLHVSGGSPNVDHSFDNPVPRGGFPIGDHYRINLVDVNNHNTIYAQSNEFTIKN